MKRTRIFLIASIAIAAALSGCANQPSQTQIDSDVAQAATLIANGCKVVQPTVTAVATATANVAVATGAAVNGVFCAANEAAVAGSASSAAAASAPVAASQ